MQWDPERGTGLGRLDHRTIQIGLRRAALAGYAAAWITGITDVTAQARKLQELLDRSGPGAVATALPDEPPYPLPAAAATAIGQTDI